MERCAPSVFPHQARQGPEHGLLQGALGLPMAEKAPEASWEAACQLLEDAGSGERFMKGILWGALLSASMWAGILLLVL